MHMLSWLSTEGTAAIVEFPGVLYRGGAEGKIRDYLVRNNFLEAAIGDYNALFSTSFDTSGEGFQNYYKDLSDRMKSRQLDMVIVVNMFLTGFDATTLNTLWVDKDLKDHGLIQAFSRTNHILNSVKTYGNIVCFRNLEDRVNHAISLFGDKDAGGIVLLKPYADYLAEYRDRLAQLYDQFPLGQVILGEEALDEAATRAFLAKAFADGEAQETGTGITALMTKKPSRFAPANAYAEMKARVLERLKAFFERFSGLSSY